VVSSFCAWSDCLWRSSAHIAMMSRRWSVDGRGHPRGILDLLGAVNLIPVQARPSCNLPWLPARRLGRPSPWWSMLHSSCRVDRPRLRMGLRTFRNVATDASLLYGVKPVVIASSCRLSWGSGAPQWKSLVWGDRVRPWSPASPVSTRSRSGRGGTLAMIAKAVPERGGLRGVAVQCSLRSAARRRLPQRSHP